MSIVKNAAPRFLFDGIDDNSRRQLPVVPLQLPTHLPLYLVRSSWGPENDQIVSGTDLKRLYGDDIFNRRSPYFTHQNLYAETSNAVGNAVMLRRIVPEDAAPPAGMTLWADVVADDLPNYERNSDGSYKVGGDGNYVVNATTPTLASHRVRLYFTELAEGALGQQTQEAGELVAERDGTSGTAFPLFDLQRPHRGKAGNLGGIRLTAPTIRSPGGTRDDLIEDQGAFLYRFQTMERPNDRSSPRIKTTISGDQAITFSFKDDVYDKYTESEYGIDQVLLQAYNAKSTDGGPHTYGTFSGYHVYKDNLEEVLQMLHAPELVHGTVGETEDDFHMVNFLTGQSYLGYPYYTIKVEGPSENGALFTESTVHYAQGGTDGTLSAESFDAGCAAFFDGFMEDPARMWDPFRCPFAVMYDSGFTLETKLKMAKMLGYRDDIYLVLSTQVWGMPMNEESQDYSIGVALKNELLSFPESVLYGTGCCRAIIIGHAGVMPGARVKEVAVPLTHKFARDCSRYMGAGDGFWATEYRPDAPGNNVVEGYTEINARAKTDRMVDEFWNNGIVWAQYKNRRDQFVPAYQTVYEDDTSVLNAAFNMIVAVDIIKVCRAVWTELVGVSDLTDAQFIQRSNDKIAKAVAGKYDGRVRIVPRTYFTEADNARGYSWSCDVDMYAGTMKTVGQFTVRANRLSDLAGEAA